MFEFIYPTKTYVMMLATFLAKKKEVKECFPVFSVPDSSPHA